MHGMELNKIVCANNKLNNRIKWLWMELNNFTIDILRPNQQLGAELAPRPKGYNLPVLAQFV